MKGVILQGFEWYLPDDGKHFDRIKKELPYLEEMGFSAIWLPPICKATGTSDVGYGIYDLYDLGEFDQKGAIRTKYGKKEDLQDLIDNAHDHGIDIYADVVLNHKAGADESEKFKAVEVDMNDRNKEIGEPREIEGWTKFTFPGRRGKYSDFLWDHSYFSGVDFDQITGKSGVYKILGEGKGWSWSVSGENGNFDYLMFANIDHNNEEVREEIFNWTKWFINEIKVDGFRFDASKHIDAGFMDDLVKFIRSEINEDFYSMAEYWMGDNKLLQDYIRKTSGNIDLFDVPLHYNFFEASKSGKDYDLRKIFHNSIVDTNPIISVTFVDNHDTQEGQALSSWVEPWFKEHAYALILLRKDGYPTVFWADLYGVADGELYGGMKEKLSRLLGLRRDYAYGSQDDYFERPNTIGFVRRGNADHPGRMAVVLTNGDEDSLPMFVGEDQAGKIFIDALDNNEGQVIIKEDGWGDFFVSPGSVSVWVEAN